MARIPYPDLDAAAAETRELLERLPAKLNVFRMMAHAESNVRPLVMLGGAILTQQALPAKVRELAILRVAALSNAEYEWIQHEAIGRAAGIDDAEIAALRSGDLEADCFDDAERAALVFTDDVLRNVRASDQTLSAVRRHFSDRETAELLLAVGYYMLIARFLETTGVDLEPAAEGLVGRRNSKRPA